MDIKFYISPNKTIPTQFALIIDNNLIVKYNDFENFDKETADFGYSFNFVNGTNYDQDYIDSVLEEIISQMCTQSFNHWQCWRELRGKRRKIVEEHSGNIYFFVYFYIRDSY